MMIVISMFAVGCGSSPKEYAAAAFEDGDMRDFLKEYKKLDAKDRPGVAYEFINEFYAQTKKQADGIGVSRLKKASKALHQLDFNDKTYDYLGILALIRDDVDTYTTSRDESYEIGKILENNGVVPIEFKNYALVTQKTFYIASMLKDKDKGMDVYAVTGYNSFPQYSTFGTHVYQSGTTEITDAETIALVKTKIPGAFSQSGLYTVNVVECDKMKIKTAAGFEKTLPVYQLIPEHVVNNARQYIDKDLDRNMATKSIKLLEKILNKTTQAYSKATVSGNVALEGNSITTTKAECDAKYSIQFPKYSRTGQATVYDRFLEAEWTKGEKIIKHMHIMGTKNKFLQIDNKNVLACGDSKEKAYETLKDYVALEKNDDHICYILPGGEILYVTFYHDKVWIMGISNPLYYRNLKL